MQVGFQLSDLQTTLSYLPFYIFSVNHLIVNISRKRIGHDMQI